MLTFHASVVNFKIWLLCILYHLVYLLSYIKAINEKSF